MRQGERSLPAPGMKRSPRKRAVWRVHARLRECHHPVVLSRFRSSSPISKLPGITLAACRFATTAASPARADVTEVPTSWASRFSILRFFMIDFLPNLGIRKQGEQPGAADYVAGEGG